MKVELISTVSLENVVRAIRKCWASEGLSDSDCSADCCKSFDLGPKDKSLVQRIIDFDHTSTLEHLNFTFEITGLSRAALQELARTRMSSLSVQSTRYTFKKSLTIKIDELVFITGDEDVDQIVHETMEKIAALYKRRPDIPNDVIKYAIPEALNTTLIWTINVRSLRNFFKLRTSKKALPEMRWLCMEIWGVLPEKVKFLFEDVYDTTVKVGE
jgi:thymidylate synthase (FAD)